MSKNTTRNSLTVLKGTTLNRGYKGAPMDYLTLKMTVAVKVEKPVGMSAEDAAQLIAEECDYRVAFSEGGLRVRGTEVVSVEPLS